MHLRGRTSSNACCAGRGAGPAERIGRHRRRAGAARARFCALWGPSFGFPRNGGRLDGAGQHEDRAEQAKPLPRAVRQQKPPKLGDVNVLPFELKAGWQAVTIEQVLVELQTGPFGSSLHQSDYQVGGVPVVNPASIQNENIVPIEKMAVGVATLNRLSTFKLKAGDIVMGRRGEMGRCAVVTDREAGWLCGTGSLVLRLPQCVYARFFVLLIGSPYVREYLGGSAVGATMQNLNQAILLSLVIGLPPLAEQHRIVTKVDELMALCDGLETSLTTADDTCCRLLGALLIEALEPGG